MQTLRVLAWLLVSMALGAGGTRQLSAQKVPADSGGYMHHVLDVRLDPATHRLSVTDEVRFPAGRIAGSRSFALNAKLAITQSRPPVEEVRMPEGPPQTEGRQDSTGGVRHYVVRNSAASALTISYEGSIDTPVSDEKEQYTRGFRETSGLIDSKGIYLSGSTVWYPKFDDSLVTFTLSAFDPPGWHLISQGNGTSRDQQGRATWDSAGATDEIYLVGGPLQLFKESAGQVEALVYLHEPEQSLAVKYLAATAQYIGMYNKLIGPYPYAKFALVENFWETGYGMPTFTLLGPQIVRFPFIINSSYPHEILHNWWGNSVFVDYDTGNWCEGLTAYLADHLIAEQRGTGDEYRRATLQKYRDYVKAGRDFPLSEFRSRASAAEEAVGYGKALMLDHMLRRSIGDDAFQRFLARFYRDFRGRRAGFGDLQHTAEAVSGTSLAWLFDELISRSGAPVLAIRMGPSPVQGRQGAYTVQGTLLQTQTGKPYVLDVPIVVQTEKGQVDEVIRLGGPARSFTLKSAEKPLMLHVDPRFDLFRRLDPRETPPSIGQIFGEPGILALLPSSGSAEEIRNYRELMAGWQSPNHSIEVKLDSEVPAIPASRTTWLLGRTNRLAEGIFSRQAGLTLGPDLVELDDEKVSFPGHTIVVTARHPDDVDKTVGWIVVDPPAAGPGLGRKLPHYGKYSFLGFEGDEPVNTVKGQWQQSDSPLRVDLREPSDRADSIAALLPDARKALAELPPAFSESALAGHVGYLASPALNGRGLGSEGLRTAASYIADTFKAIGLRPGGDGGSYLQSFMVQAGEDGQPHEVANLIGVLPGARPEWKDQTVVVSAHYDHLGFGWPDVHKGDEGKVHPGADDNASGVAVLLELARSLAGDAAPPRAIVFIAFTGEEAGRLGSKYYVDHPFGPLDRIMGVINLDTVGRLGRDKVSVLGTGSATEWQHIFRGAGLVTGVEPRLVPESATGSDQASFTERGVPAVQIFTAATADYHRPSDTPDKIDAAGLAKVAALTREGVAYLAERPEPLTNTLKPASTGAPAAQPGAATSPAAAGAQPAARRVSLGTVPDFAFQGPGVRVTGTTPDSPAAKAGIVEGDVLTSIDGRSVPSLQAFSDILRTLKPGQTVEVLILRAAKELRLTITLAER